MLFQPTAQAIFTNFKNVIDSTARKLPFGIAQIGKSFRNEVTTKAFIFRTREFEQMEIEFFCHPDDADQWYEFWRRDNVSFAAFSESNLHSIRRTATLQISEEQDQVLITCQVHTERLSVPSRPDTAIDAKYSGM